MGRCRVDVANILERKSALIAFYSYFFISASFCIKYLKVSIENLARYYNKLDDSKKNIILWPAKYYYSLLTKIFKNNGGKISEILSLRSLVVTFGISFLINSICILIVLVNKPNGYGVFNEKIVGALFKNYIFFILINYLGDVVSISITRNMLHRLVNDVSKVFKCLFIDMLGILCGYVISFTIPLVLYFVVFGGGAGSGELFNSGLFGIYLIPFYLFIFTFSEPNLYFGVVAFLSIFSITIPTIIYLALFIINFSAIYFPKKLKKIIQQDLTVTIANILSLVGRLGIVFVGVVSLIIIFY